MQTFAYCSDAALQNGEGNSSHIESNNPQHTAGLLATNLCSSWTMEITPPCESVAPIPPFSSCSPDEVELTNCPQELS